MRKKVISTCCAIILCATAFAQGNTEKNYISITNAFFAGFSTAMSPMEDYLNAKAEPHESLTLGRVGFSFEGSAFIVKNLAYHVRLSPYLGRELADLTNKEISLVGFNTALGLEYYCDLGNSNKLSFGAGVGYDIFSYFYHNHSARFANYTVPLSVTFWHEHVGYSLSYEPCFAKEDPRNNASALPKLASNFVSLSFRVR